MSIKINALIGTTCALVTTAALANQPPASNPPLSELDALSQRNNDPFGEIILERSRKPVSVTVRALDKIIARTIDIEIPMNEVAKFGTLELLPRYCDKRPPEDFPETSAFLEVFDKPFQKKSKQNADTDDSFDNNTEASLETLDTAPENNTNADPIILADPTAGPKTDGDRIFTGWMFASSPALNALEHPVYDVWVIDCKTQLVENDAE